MTCLGKQMSFLPIIESIDRLQRGQWACESLGNGLGSHEVEHGYLSLVSPMDGPEPCLPGAVLAEEPGASTGPGHAPAPYSSPLLTFPSGGA